MTTKVHLGMAGRESGTFSRAKNGTLGKIVLTDRIVQERFHTQNTLRCTESIAGRRAQERTFVRICAIFEIAMMSPPSGFSPSEKGLLR